VLVGIVGTWELVREATLRKEATLIASYATAVNQFKEKYNAFPGDMPNAVNLLPSTTFPIRNGNGNRIIDCDASLPPSAAGQECAEALAHLSITRFIPGGYTAQTAMLQLGDNVVDAPNGLVLGLANDGAVGAIYGRRGNVISLARSDLSQVFCFWCGLAFSAQDAYEIDMKLDDGLPASGYLQGIDQGTNSANGALCASNTSWYYSVYIPFWAVQYGYSAFGYSRYKDSNNGHPMPDKQDVCRLFYYLN